jgi:hypothetical protein
MGLLNPCQTVKTIGESLPESPENLRSEVTAGTLLADPRSPGLLKFRVPSLKGTCVRINRDPDSVRLEFHYNLSAERMHFPRIQKSRLSRDPDLFEPTTL